VNEKITVVLAVCLTAGAVSGKVSAQDAERERFQLYAEAVRKYREFKTRTADAKTSHYRDIRRLFNDIKETNFEVMRPDIIAIKLAQGKPLNDQELTECVRGSMSPLFIAPLGKYSVSVGKGAQPTPQYNGKIPAAFTFENFLLTTGQLDDYKQTAKAQEELDELEDLATKLERKAR
jgi:hypothetical protein